MFFPRIVAVLALTFGVAHAQNSQTGPIHIQTGSSSTAGNLISRMIAPIVSETLGQPIVVENNSSGIILGQKVAKSAPDGRTLLVTGASFWLAPLVMNNVPWDPVKDFEQVSLMTTTPNLVVVHPSVPAKSLKEFIAYAKSKPGQLNFGAGTVGSTPHLAGELFITMAGVDLKTIPYKGIASAVVDLLAGGVQVVFPPAASAAKHIKSGSIRALAVTTLKRSPLFPDLPSVSESGLTGYQAEVINGMFAPAKTPAAALSRVSKAFNAALLRPDIKEKLFAIGVDSIGGSPEDLKEAVTREITVWGKIIREKGIHTDL